MSNLQSNVVLLKHKISKVNTPTKPKLQTLDGNLTIEGIEKASFHEKVKIGLNIKANKDTRTSEEWKSIVTRREPINPTKARSFRIDENYWFGRGATWIVATQLFAPTQVKLKLQPSPLLANGFTIELYLRYITIVKQFPSDPALSAGGIITCNINWAVYPNVEKASPNLEVKSWKSEATCSNTGETSRGSRSSSVSVWSHE